MQIKIFTIPILGGETENEALNVFLNSHKVVELEKQLIPGNTMSYWSFCVKYLVGDTPGRILKYPEKVDYRKELPEVEFKPFAKFREIRKQIAQQEAIPAFAIFTDAELAEMAKLEILSIENIQSIKGIGEKKLEKYGLKFIEMNQDV